MGERDDGGVREAWDCGCEDGGGGAETEAEFGESAGETFLGGVFADAEGEADVAEWSVFEEAELDGGAVWGGKTGDGGGEAWAGFGRREGFGGGGGGGDEFAGAAAGFAALEVGGGVDGAVVEPAAEAFGGVEGVGAGGELDEDTLNDVVGHGGVAVETLEGCAVDEVAVAGDEGGERCVAAAIREALEQGGDVVVWHFEVKRRCGRGSDRKFASGGRIPVKRVNGLRGKWSNGGGSCRVRRAVEFLSPPFPRR